jgi:hypothetical protein
VELPYYLLGVGSFQMERMVLVGAAGAEVLDRLAFELDPRGGSEDATGVVARSAGSEESDHPSCDSEDLHVGRRISAQKGVGSQRKRDSSPAGSE